MEMLIGLTATHRDDGTMFVVSETHPYITAVVDDRDWEAVLEVVRATLQANFGPVKGLEYLEDGDKLQSGVVSDHVPPAHVISARVAVERVGFN